MISHTYKFIFVHIPKTGGTAIMTALRPYGLMGEGHYTLREIKNGHNISPQQDQEYFKFAVVRNPWDVVVSNYHYSRMKKSYWHSDDRTTAWPLHPDYEIVKEIEFKEYVGLVVENKLKHPFSLIPQRHWIDESIDYFIRFEDLAWGFSQVCTHLGIGEIKIPKINSSQHNHYSTYYDEESKKSIAKHYKGDIEYWDYEFEDASN